MGYKITEHMEQAAVIKWSLIQGRNKPELLLLYATPNGGERNEIVAKKLKAEGVKAGVPDLFLPVPRGGFHGLYVEMKRSNGKPSDVSKDQSAWIDALNAQGYLAVVCFGAQDAIATITKYLEGERWQ